MGLALPFAAGLTNSTLRSPPLGEVHAWLFEVKSAVGATTAAPIRFRVTKPTTALGIGVFAPKGVEIIATLGGVEYPMAGRGDRWYEITGLFWDITNTVVTILARNNNLQAADTAAYVRVGGGRPAKFRAYHNIQGWA